MPAFRYSARDAQNAPRQGEIQATSANDAISLLSRQGLRIEKLEAAPLVNPAAPTVLSTPPRAVQRAGQVPAVVAPVQTGATRVRRLKYKDMHLLFAQLADRIGAGISPADAFFAQADMEQDPKVSAALRYVAKETAQGRKPSECLAELGLFVPTYVCGMLRAGEYGGYMAESYGRVSAQTGDANKFQRYFWFFWFIFINGIIIIPAAILMMRGFVKAYDVYEKTNGSGGSPTDLVFKSMGAFFAWPYGPLIVLLLGLLFGGVKCWNMPFATRLRHKIGFWHPYMVARAKHENIAIFTWALDGLTRGGVSPYSAWNLAAEAAPNLVMRERLTDVGRRLREGSRLSEIVRSTNVLPPEYANLIATGEDTGTAADALRRISDMSYNDFQTSSVAAKGIWTMSGCLMFAIFGMIAFTIVMYFWYKVFYGRVLEGMDASLIWKVW